MNFAPPDADEFEVSIFGPGRGECILVHLGYGDWICVDSLIDRVARRPISLHYLEQLGIDASEALRLLVVTHWHQDHMKGAAEILDAAPSAQFACSGALRSEDFWRVVGASEGARHEQQPLHELALIMGLLETRRREDVRRESAAPFWLQEGTQAPFARQENGAPPVHITVVSPSNGARRLGMEQLAASIPDLGSPKRRAVALGPNQQSVALWIETGDIKMLLGGDLEDSADAWIGWKAVLASLAIPRSRAALFKIPHHGSAGADNVQVWEERLEPAPIALVSPFVPQLPTEADQRRIADRTPFAYCTANPLGARPRAEDRVVQRKLRERPRRIREVVGDTGHVRVRKRLSGEEGARVELSPHAFQLD